MITPTKKRAALAAKVRGKHFTVVPGVYDMISARVADQTGFEALYMSGYGIAASHLGLPDAGLASFTDLVERARTISAGTRAPLIADGDTGFGGLLNLRHTVEGYEAAGVAAIQLEDQEFPKKCGHSHGRRVIATKEMVKKIEVAVASRCDSNFLIVARTDARSRLGLKEAIIRGRDYAAAGADLVFVESPESIDEFAEIGEALDVPLVANMVEGGFSPVLASSKLAELGFTLAIYPGTGFLSVSSVLKTTYAHLRQEGSSAGMPHQILSVREMHTLMDFESVWAFDKRWAEDDAWD